MAEYVERWMQDAAMRVMQKIAPDASVADYVEGAWIIAREIQVACDRAELRGYLAAIPDATCFEKVV